MTLNQSNIPGMAPIPQARRARNSDPDTSHQAAAALGVDRLTVARAEVLALLVEHGAMCDSVIALRARRIGSRQSPSGLRTRRAELVTFGKVRDSGKRVTLPSGRNSIVWEAIPHDERRGESATADA